MTGQVLGPYRVLENIGSGGTGEVYRAQDDRLGRAVAIKILKSSLAQERDRMRRFEQEARAAAALNHPNIVAVYDIGVHHGSPYIVTEYLEGQTLRHRLLDGYLPLRLVADYGMQIAQGLAAAHEKHIVHRDLKPENLFLTRDGRVKILDFGIAKLITSDSDDGALASQTTQTKAGSVLGTVAYMSPEQLRAKPVDHRSDIFSLGAILYEMLTGRRAFASDTDVDTMTAVLKEDPPEMAQFRAGIPPTFERIVRHCMEKDPEARFQSAQDLVFALSSITDISTSKQVLPSFRFLPSRIQRWIFWLALFATLILAAVFLGKQMAEKPAPRYHRISFERGTIYSARFSSDGQSVIYAASWNGHSLQIYSTIGDSVVARPVGFSGAHLLAVSRKNELALALHGVNSSHLEVIQGTLASSPLVGGTPREILQDVRSADWSGTEQLAVAHYADGRYRLEFPVGHVLYETTGWISHLRVSPDGGKIAFLDHPTLYDDQGTVAVVDMQGRKTTLTPEWDSEDGLAWSPQSSEIWFSAVRHGNSRSLWAVDLSGHLRQVLTLPGGFTLQDISRDGHVLGTFDVERLAMEWNGKDDKGAQDLSWYNWSVARDVSRDGQWVLFSESSEPVGPNYAVGIRNVDGSPPIRLGEGVAGGLSPDGQWATATVETPLPHIILLPVGAGQARQIALPAMEQIVDGSARFLPDGHRLTFSGREHGKLRRTYWIDLDGVTPHPITPEGVTASLPSPDGKYLVGTHLDGKLTLYPVYGGVPRAIPNLPSGYVPAQWTADGKGLYVCHSGDVPLSISRVDIATGLLTAVRMLVPADRAGVVTIAPVITNYAQSGYAYSYYQTLSVLYEVTGLH
jgi:serine/threonine protein kinase/Tol biopolymer transport system component